MIKSTTLFLGLFLSLVVTTTNAGKTLKSGNNEFECPPPGLDSKPTLDVASYISKRWYSVMQIPVQYQPENIFFCTYAEYTLLDSKSVWCRFLGIGCGKEDARIKVFNRATRGLNGQETTAELRGNIPDLKRPTKLLVGPTFLPNLFYGPYWIMEAGTYRDLLEGKTSFDGNIYEWALISGGSPEKQGEKGCITGSGPNNFKGLWIFSRDPVPPAGVIEAVERLAISKGYDTSAMKRVVQKDCIY